MAQTPVERVNLRSTETMSDRLTEEAFCAPLGAATRESRRAAAAAPSAAKPHADG